MSFNRSGSTPWLEVINWTTRVPSASLSLTYEGALWVNRLCAMVTKIHCMKTKGKRPVITSKVWSARNGEWSGCFLDCKSWSNVHSPLNISVYHFSKKKSHYDLLHTPAVYIVLKFCQLVFNSWVNGLGTKSTSILYFHVKETFDLQ